jgi:hypothetical protein
VSKPYPPRRPFAIYRSVFLLFATVPVALAIDVVLWGVARFFAPGFMADFDDDRVWRSYLVIVVMGGILFLAITLPPWSSPTRVRMIVATVSAVILIIVCSLLLRVEPVGPLFNT